MSIINIKENIGIPKYKQIVNSIENGIINQQLKKGDKLPSINSIRNKFSLSRDTVLLAFSELKTRGIVQSIAGKGYYIKSTNTDITQKIFLLFDELNTFKEDLFNAFVQTLDSKIQVDIFFHHFNFDVFSKLIYDNIGNYNHYIIMPANLENTNTVINKLPQDKVYILDQMHEELKDYPSIYQNFEKDIYNGLTKGKDLLKKYNKITFLCPKFKQPNGLRIGFEKFCKEQNISFLITNSMDDFKPVNKEVYLIPDDRNLIKVIKEIKAKKLILGKNIGIICYNDTLLKEIVEGGITTISTDFRKMGEKLAEMITNNTKESIENPNDLIIRNSL